MGFAQTDTAVEHQGVEGCFARVLGHGISGCACQTVAFAFHEVL